SIVLTLFCILHFILLYYFFLFFFFFTPTATSDLYTLSLHDALPIFSFNVAATASVVTNGKRLLIVSLSLNRNTAAMDKDTINNRSEEHTSELQSPYDLVCRLLLEKKKKKKTNIQ